MYCEQYVEYDPFFTQPEYPNPWLTDSVELWDQEIIPWVIKIIFLFVIDYLIKYFLNVK